MNSTTPLDLVAVLTLGATALSGRPTASEILAAYFVIFACALSGAGYSATRRELAGRRSGNLLYIAVWTVAALVVTVPVSEVAAAHIGGTPARWLFGVVAGLIGAAGADLPRLLLAATRLARPSVLRLAARAFARWLAAQFPADPSEGPRP